MTDLNLKVGDMWRWIESSLRWLITPIRIGRFPRWIESSLRWLITPIRIGRFPRRLHSPYGRRSIWSLRHWLITKLACGDMIMMNFERRCTGNIVPKNLGDALVHNVDIEGMIGERQGVNMADGTSRLDLSKRSSMPIGHVGGILLFSDVKYSGRNTGGDFPPERDVNRMGSTKIWIN